LKPWTREPDKAKDKTHFENLTPLFPEQTPDSRNGVGRIEHGVLDLVCPIGKGTRGLIVAPPRTGKNGFDAKDGQSILKNNPETYLFILLIDERRRSHGYGTFLQRRGSHQLHVDERGTPCAGGRNGHRKGQAHDEHKREW